MRNAELVFPTNAVAPIRSRAVVDRVRDGTGVAAFMSSGLGGVANKTDSYSASESGAQFVIRSYRGREVAW